MIHISGYGWEMLLILIKLKNQDVITITYFNLIIVVDDNSMPLEYVL
jgi:hypothetical protein